jgi:hypothetical protein
MPTCWSWRLSRWCLAIILLAQRVSADDDGESLVADAWARHRSVRTEREEAEILVVTGPLPARFTRADAESMLRRATPHVTHKRAVRHVLYASDWHDRIHILFSLPSEDAGLGFLVWRQPNSAQDEMYLYMPGYRSVRRVPLGSDQPLAETDLLYEDVRDLAGERTAGFTYSQASGESVEGRPCDVIVAKPKAGTVTAYGSRKVWLDRDWHFPLRVEFHDAAGALWKVMHNSDIHEIAPGVRRADFTEMRDVQQQQATLLLVTKREVGLQIPDRVFTEDYLVHPGND